MNYKIFLNLLIFIGFCSVSSAKQYRIHGEIKKLPDNTVYLTKIGTKLNNVDSTESKNGFFTFTGVAITEPKLYCIRVKGKFSPLLNFYLDEGDINIKGELYKDIFAFGTPINDAYSDYVRVIYPLLDKQTRLKYSVALNFQKSGRVKDVLTDSVRSLNEQLFDQTRGLIKKYNKSMVVLQILNDRVQFMSIPEIEAILSELDSKTFDSNQEIANIRARIITMKSIGIGQLAPDISLLDTAGHTVTLASLKGKFVLIDFWASWCVPCRAENPNIKSAYALYADKGFTVLGVSLDKKSYSWVGAIKKDELKWLNVIDPDGKTAKSYAVLSIPQNFLIGPDRRIIAIGLRGEELQDKLKAVLPGRD